MKKVRKQDQLFFYERHFLTLDGLWMIETEKAFDWDFALKIDLAVWNRFLKAMIEDIMKYKNLNQQSIQNLISILAFRWKVEGWDFYIKMINNQSKMFIKINRCPYNSAMLRNPERHDKIPLICKNMCIPFYENIISNFNKDIHLIRKNYLGLENHYCDFTLSYKSGEKIKGNIEEIIKNIEEISVDDKLFYFKNGFKLLNEFWVDELRKRTNFNETLKVNQIVWKRLFKIVLRRIKRYKDYSTNSLLELISILEFIWDCEDLKFQKLSQEEGKVHFKIEDCPIELLANKNSDINNQYLKSLKQFQNSIYSTAIKSFNAKLEPELLNFNISDGSCFELMISKLG